MNKYDPIAEVNTDKVNAEVPSSFSGIIKELVAEEGDTLAVGEIICTIEIEGGACYRRTAAAESKMQQAVETIPAATAKLSDEKKAIKLVIHLQF